MPRHDMTKQNPLLIDGGESPSFHRIAPEHAVPAIEARLSEGRALVSEVSNTSHPSWSSVVTPLEAADDRLGQSWAPIRHLHAVADTPAWRRAYNHCLTLLEAYRTERGQNDALYRLYEALSTHPEAPGYSPAQRKTIEDALREFRLAGVDLCGPDKARFKALSADLAELGSRFGENVLDATQGWRKHLTRPETLAGLPDTVMALARARAEREGREGWLLTLDFPVYSGVMNHALDRSLREEVYEAYVTRASDQSPNAGKWDNAPLIEAILTKRHELARLCGFASYAEYSLARKMADSPEQVRSFLADLARRSKPVAERERADLEEYAREDLGLDSLQAWDVAFAAEQLRQARFSLSQEALRPYFPLPKVLDGLFTVTSRLFGVSITGTAAETWAPEVQCFEIRDRDGERLGSFYLDAFARDGKRGGAWMDECVGRRRTERGIQHPIAFLSCNFAPPVGGGPSLLTHEEVLTLFHEFGHGLHHLLTRVDIAAVSGINGVPWDAVELPSQFLENWCWEEEGLALVSAHVQTGEALPADLIRRLRKARSFMAGMQMVRQIEFALLDLRAHAETAPGTRRSILALHAEVRAEVAVIEPPCYNRFANAFTHIFSGGYACGYYSYKWAEVLAADAFARFEEEGLFDEKCGQAFRQSILERGGSEDAMALFREFRGRAPDIRALLRHRGIDRTAPGQPRG